MHAGNNTTESYYGSHSKHCSPLWVVRKHCTLNSIQTCKTLASMADQFGITPKSAKKRDCLPDTIKDAILVFYEREDIACWTPGSKEYVTAVVDGKKTSS